MRTPSIALVLSGICLIAATSLADEAPTTKANLEPIPRSELEIVWTALRESDDLAFDQFVPEDSLRAAFYWGDVELLADCALQLAHGERVLLREHKAGVTAKMALDYAAKSAAGSSQEGLTRLVAVAKSLGQEELAAQISAVQQTVAPSRGAGGVRLRRLGSVRFRANEYQQLKGHKLFGKLFRFHAQGIVTPAQGVSMYINDKAKHLAVFNFGVTQSPEYITFAESTKWSQLPSGSVYYHWCSCNGEQVSAGQTTVPADSLDQCRFTRETSGWITGCGGSCAGTCEQGTQYLQIGSPGWSPIANQL